MSKTNAQLRASVNAGLNLLAATYGENADLSTNQDALNEVSYSVDNKNETWNGDLPPRPKNP